MLKSISLDKYFNKKSFEDDLRSHSDPIYVTDAGPVFLVLSQKTGQGHCLLDDDTTTRCPMLGKGKKMMKPDRDDVAL